MKITFCISGFSRNPVGGEKIIYELANRLIEKKVQISIVSVSGNCLLKTHLPIDARVKICDILTKHKRLPNWFTFEEEIKLITVKDYSPKNFPDADFIVATAVDTAEEVSSLPLRKGKKVYLIQDFENWNCKDEEVFSTYKLGMLNITISSWLQQLVQKYDLNETKYISNAIDTDVFSVINSIDKRNKHSIGILYHPGEHKGFRYALHALEIVKDRYPDITVHAFGSPKRPRKLPAWFTYQRSLSPSQLNILYNNCSIFVCASVEEGFGLTGAESMACGCALASTAYKGVTEYAVNNINALLSPIKNINQLANNICYLIKDDSLRLRLAKQATNDIKRRNWNNFVTQFIQLVLKDE